MMLLTDKDGQLLAEFDKDLPFTYIDAQTGQQRIAKTAVFTFPIKDPPLPWLKLLLGQGSRLMGESEPIQAPGPWAFKVPGPLAAGRYEVHIVGSEAGDNTMVWRKTHCTVTGDIRTLGESGLKLPDKKQKRALAQQLALPPDFD